MEHTLGFACRLKPVPHIEKENGLPHIEAQFFYSSPIPIDDPLSTKFVAGSSDPKSVKGQLRPFSPGDNNILERRWLALASEIDHKQHFDAWHGRDPIPASAEAYGRRRDAMVQALALKHWYRHQSDYEAQKSSMNLPKISPTASLPCCSQLGIDVSVELNQKFCALAQKTNTRLKVDVIVQDVLVAIHRHKLTANDDNVFKSRLSSSSPHPSFNQPRGDFASSTSPATVRNMKLSKNENNKAENYQSPGSFFDRGGPSALDLHRVRHSSHHQTLADSVGPAYSVTDDDGISGKPFERVGSPELVHSSGLSLLPNASYPNLQAGNVEPHGCSRVGSDSTAEETSQPVVDIPRMDNDNTGDVVVGVSRLHMVSLPMLQMKPIYWSPVNDIAVVTRGTWFYRDTMLPVQPAVANQLEAGYQELCPWTETWGDEIRCAIEVGAIGEEKVAHRLWPVGEALHRNKHKYRGALISSHPFCSARCFRGEAAGEGYVETSKTDDEITTESASRAYSNYHVIYKDKMNAFLVRPNLRPSAQYGRRPIFKIMKGLTVGIPVVRGFDRKAWEHIQGGKPIGLSKLEPSQPNSSTEPRDQGVCHACQDENDRGQVTDLVLVAHGIGQKIAERVESYHFTHAINGFRRAVNVELRSAAVKQVLRDGQNGLMILPLNWRIGLSFEDAASIQAKGKGKTANVAEPFGLKDIEPDSIPAVRSMISDVMFDIPFYMSHHKEKMIEALITEANRVYRLWCRNNPGFVQNGRVHLLAHSLGSAMAIEILSRQPTNLIRLDLVQPNVETRFFEFDTKNLFLVGSPAGFFLLLERGTLTPRRGRQKPGTDVSDTVADNVVGDAGTFGCLAVDNIYNILAKEDPIAYLLNGAIDPAYAASLKMAYVPTTSVSLLKTVGNVMRSVVPGMAPNSNTLMTEPERPSAIRLPSQLELEVHDFTREEVAEKKAYLLNDNGQIDWFLRSGGGPLEIQYLNMLSAHTSYWTNSDFIRMLCMEIGRKPGRANTLPAMRAIKASTRRIPTVK